MTTNDPNGPSVRSDPSDSSDPSDPNDPNDLSTGSFADDRLYGNFARPISVRHVDVLFPLNCCKFLNISSILLSTIMYIVLYSHGYLGCLYKALKAFND